MAKRQSKGICYICKRELSDTGMTRHVAACVAKNVPLARGKGMGRTADERAFHLVVDATDCYGYWLHLAIHSEASLARLDHFLREIWVECCDHGSTFIIDGVDDEPMDVALDALVGPGVTFTYEYDFGSTTKLTLKVAGDLGYPLEDEPIALLARNHPPHIPCGSCGKPAEHVCGVCVWQDRGWLCGECLDDHECGEDVRLPVVNSPRVGICGYTGGG